MPTPPLLPPQAHSANHTPDAALETLRRVFQHARSGRAWFSLNVDEISRAIGEPRERIVAAIGYLEESGDLIVKASGVRHGYVVLRPPDDLDALCRTLSERFQKRERRDIARTRRVLQYARNADCLTQDLLSYFGEERGRCGHCGQCERPAPEGSSARVPCPQRPETRSIPAGPVAFSTSQAASVRSLLAEKHEALASARQMTRFLCGLSSPATSRARLRAHPLFGLFESIAFHDVLTFVARLSLGAG